VRNRMWRFCARTVVATTVTAVTLGGGALAFASPASAAVPPIIKVTNGEFEIVLPDGGVGTLAAEDDVTGSTGFGALVDIVIQPGDFDLEGEIHGTLRTYDFRSMWEVYTLDPSDGLDRWIDSFRSDSGQEVLKETLRQELELEVTIHLTFRVAAADLDGVARLRIGFDVLRLEFESDTKDFMILNEAGGGAKDQDGNDVPVDMELDVEFEEI
jgi:hypothetical protein